MSAKFVDVNQLNWDKLFPAVVWSDNTTKHCATGCLPFEQNHEFAATMEMDVQLTEEAEKQPASGWMHTLKRQVKFLQQLNLAHQQAAAQQQAKQHNKWKEPAEQTIKVGDLVQWKWLWQQSNQKLKLASIWCGPYTVTKRV